MTPAPPPDPNDFSAKYNTPIPPDKQAAYDQWGAAQKQKTGKDPRKDNYDYDVKGFFMAGDTPDARGHGSDQFKKPNEPTFSDQSKYNGVDGYTGGSWIDAPGMKPQYPGDVNSKPGFFQPSQTNLHFNEGGMAGLQQHFNDPRVGDRNVKLLPPLDVTTPPLPAGLAPVPGPFRAAQPAPMQVQPTLMQRARRLFGQ